MKKAVLFDLDGVLLDSMAYHVKAWQEVFLQFDVQIEPNEVYKREGTRTAELAGNLAETVHLNLSPEKLQEIIKEIRNPVCSNTKSGFLRKVFDYFRICCSSSTGFGV